ncbi:protein FAR1-RELATED SEQUENCE 5-like [Cornus florida]|uniref:protein FAR1-RELATED SEQUENCE 5-like n=1 Tax=Cornus florida TaxID=4283 RepID=UPI0028999B66|nr:protein FAR1-RELATED SEQUENCE 5-like [Cornus florida]
MLIAFNVEFGKYIVKDFKDTHIQPLISEDYAHMMPSQRKIKSVQAIDVELAADCGIPTQCLKDPSFFYAVQLDSSAMITNIFWVDSKMISDYVHFGDVLTFDTTYKLVHGNRPFVVFLGLNHHRETVVFGAAFMYDETTNLLVGYSIHS